MTELRTAAGCNRCRGSIDDSGYRNCTRCRRYMAAWKRAKLAERRAVDLCPGCGAQRDDGLAFCTGCRISVNERRAALVAEGRCSNCGRPRGVNATWCDPCALAMNGRLRLKYQTDPAWRAAVKGTALAWRKRRAEAAGRVFRPRPRRERAA